MISTTERPTATGIATPDTANATTIGWDKYTANWTEADANDYWPGDYWKSRKGDYWHHQDAQNRGLKNGPTWYNQAYINAWSNRDIIKMFAVNLELLPRQQDRATRYFLGQKLGNWGIRKELVAWAVCAYIVHSDKKDQRRAHPQTKNGEKADQFWDMAYHLDLTMRERVKTYHKVQTSMEAKGGGGYIKP